MKIFNELLKIQHYFISVGLIIGAILTFHTEKECPVSMPSHVNTNNGTVQDDFPKPTILYYIGNRRLWSTIRQDSTSYVFSSGNSIPPASMYSKSYTQESFDTVKVIKECLPIIKWGLDSLPILSKKMYAVPDTSYNPLSSVLSIYLNGELVFTKDYDVSEYEGPNSSDFNDKLSKLTALMLWLSLPEKKIK